MPNDVSFADARTLVVEALREHYAARFPEKELLALATGRDLGDSWAVFLALGTNGCVDTDLMGAPVMIVSKASGQLSMRQIPPSFEILDAPLVCDDAVAKGDGTKETP